MLWIAQIVIIIYYQQFVKYCYLLLLIFMLLRALCTVSNLADQFYTNKSFTEQTQSQICSLLTVEVAFS